MGTPYLGEIKIISWNYAPKGWAFCGGQFLAINQNQALFAILGTTYGGNGQTTFALPDFRGRIPMHAGQSHTLGEKAGETAHTLNISEMPAHNHLVKASGDTAGSKSPSGKYFGVTATANEYRADTVHATTLNPASVANVGGSQPHPNMPPYLVLNFIIALQGVFPSQN